MVESMIRLFDGRYRPPSLWLPIRQGLSLARACVRYVGSIGFWAFAAYAAVVTSPALAQLPTPVDPDSGTVADGDYIDYMKFTTKDIVLVLLAIVMTVGFLIVGMSTFNKFMEARRGRAEWSEVGITAGIGAALLVGAAFLFGQAETVIV